MDLEPAQVFVAEMAAAWPLLVASGQMKRQALVASGMEPAYLILLDSKVALLP